MAAPTGSLSLLLQWRGLTLSRLVVAKRRVGAIRFSSAEAAAVSLGEPQAAGGMAPTKGKTGVFHFSEGRLESARGEANSFR